MPPEPVLSKFEGPCSVPKRSNPNKRNTQFTISLNRCCIIFKHSLSKCVFSNGGSTVIRHTLLSKPDATKTKESLS
jgi:hypothetical protein